MIQAQQWFDHERILITDERCYGSVQVYVPTTDKEKWQDINHADALIYALWVDEPCRKNGVARTLIETAEREAKAHGCKSVCLEWDRRESEEWTLRWYERLGYEEKEFGRDCSLLVKRF